VKVENTSSHLAFFALIPYFIDQSPCTNFHGFLPSLAPLQISPSRLFSPYVLPLALSAPPSNTSPLTIPFPDAIPARPAMRKGQLLHFNQNSSSRPHAAPPPPTPTLKPPVRNSAGCLTGRAVWGDTVSFRNAFSLVKSPDLFPTSLLFSNPFFSYQPFEGSKWTCAIPLLESPRNSFYYSRPATTSPLRVPELFFDIIPSRPDVNLHCVFFRGLKNLRRV